jgi:hypothetical protein
MFEQTDREDLRIREVNPNFSSAGNDFEMSKISIASLKAIL